MAANSVCTRHHISTFTKATEYRQIIPTNQDTGINLDIEENSPFQEGIISETLQRLDKMFFSKSEKV